MGAAGCFVLSILLKDVFPPPVFVVVSSISWSNVLHGTETTPIDRVFTQCLPSSKSEEMLPIIEPSCLHHDIGPAAPSSKHLG